VAWTSAAAGPAPSEQGTAPVSYTHLDVYKRQSMMIARSVARLECAQRPYRVVLDSGEALSARSIVIASGAQYNKPRIANLEQFEGDGIYYGATYMESQLCGGEEVAVVGGGNSAGQAAVFLSQTASRVHMLVRSGELASTMSRYLVQRLTEKMCIRDSR